MQVSHGSKIAFVRFLYFCVVAFEMPKFLYIIPACMNSNGEPYRMMPQFIDDAPSRSSPYWIFVHSLMSNLLIVAIGLKMLGYEVRQRVIAYLWFFCALFMLPSINHFGRAPDLVAAVINLSSLIGITALFYYQQYFAFLVALSVPLWFFDVSASLFYAWRLLTGQFDSKFTLFMIQFMTSDAFYPAYMKMGVFLLSIAGMIGGAYVFVTIPEKKTE